MATGLIIANHLVAAVHAGPAGQLLPLARRLPPRRRSGPFSSSWHSFRGGAAAALIHRF